MTFIHPRSTEPMLRTEIMIDLDVDLVPAERVQDLRRAARASRDGAAHPAIDSHVQAIDGLAADRGWSVKGVGKRHLFDDGLDQPCGIEPRAVWIAGVQRIAKDTAC